MNDGASDDQSRRPFDFGRAEKIEITSPQGMNAELADDNRIDLSRRSQIENSKTELPTAGLSASMAPEAAAGVLLSKYVLAIVAATILILLSYLFYIESSSKGDLSRSYDQVYSQVAAGGAAIDPSKIDALIELTKDTMQTEKPAVSAEKEAWARQITRSLLDAKLISDGQRTELDSCLPVPAENKAQSLTACVDLLQTVKLAAVSAAMSYDKIRLLTEFSKTVDEHQRAAQAFWLQVAQLLLLNLLLPLLTGLFGYIFGTQGGSRKSG